jgi:hypothetical protein
MSMIGDAMWRLSDSTTHRYQSMRVPKANAHLGIVKRDMS